MSLDGLRVLVTRPAHQAEPLCRAIEAAGGVALRLPVLAIEPVADAEAARQALHAARDAAAWIFTSANAVAFARQFDPGPWPARLAAAGAATAAALQRLGPAEVLVPTAAEGAAGLLALPAFAVVQGRRLAIVGGERPLPDLAQGLAARGAQVTSIAVYRRRALQPAPDALAAAIDAAQIAIVTSADALTALLQSTTGATRARLLDLALAVPSARVVEKAREAGFRQPAEVPARITDADWLDLLHSWLQRRRRDRRIDLR